MSLQDLQCQYCHCLYLSDNSRNKIFTCKTCHSYHVSRKDLKKIIHPPIWLDGGKKERYDLPTELKDLRVGEQLLIQLYSPYVPVVHIKNGTLGIKGHCISFIQDIGAVANSLPRVNSKVIRFVKQLNSDEKVCQTR